MVLTYDCVKIPSSSVIRECQYYYQFSVLLNFKNIFGQWTRSQYPFIFDTGAGFSIAPESLMHLLNLREDDTIVLTGLNSKPECRVIAKLAKVTYRVMDADGKSSKELDGWFAFHPFNQLYILGIREILKSNSYIEKANFKLNLNDFF